MSGRALAGRRVMIVRPAERAAGLAELLRAMAAAVEVRPTVAFAEPRDRGPVEEALRALAEVDWLIFTSPAGVEAFARLHAETLDAEPACARLPRVAAIGPRTARELVRRGMSCAVIAEDSRSEGLAAALARERLDGRRVLLVRPEVARPVLPEALRAAGARVAAIAFYRSVRHPEAFRAAEALLAGRVDVSVFGSASSVARLLEGAGHRVPEARAALARARCVAIGVVTAAALERAGAGRVGVAERPTDEATAAAVVEILRD